MFEFRAMAPAFGPMFAFLPPAPDWASTVIVLPPPVAMLTESAVIVGLPSMYA